MIDNFKLLKINNWKQHVQLQLKLMSLSVKNSIKKIKAITRLKKRHALINLTSFISKNYKRLESFIVSSTGYEIIDITNAFASSSFMLIFVKIGFFCLFSYQISFIFNLLLLVSFFGISLYYNVNFYIRYMMYKIIKNALSEYFFGFTQISWANLKIDIEQKMSLDSTFKYNDINGNIFKLPIDHWYHKTAIFIFTGLIQIRLFMLSEPFLFIFGRFIIVYWLLVNKYLIITYMISIIVLTGRYILLYQHNDFKSLKLCLTGLWLIETNEIKATKTNAFIILMSITQNIKMDRNEFDWFYKKKSEEAIKYTKKYAKYDSFLHEHNIIELLAQLTNYYPNLKNETEMQLIIHKKNSMLKKICTSLLLSGVIIFIFSVSNSANFIEFGIFDPVIPCIQVGKLEVNQTYNFFKRFFPNLCSRISHNSYMVMEVKNKEKFEGRVVLPNTTSLKYFHPQHLTTLHFSNTNYGMVNRSFEWNLTPDIYQFYNENATPIRFPETALKNINTLDGVILNILCEDPRFQNTYSKWFNLGSSPIPVNSNYIQVAHLNIQPQKFNKELCDRYNKAMRTFLMNIAEIEKMPPAQKLFYEKELDFFLAIERKTDVLLEIGEALTSSDQSHYKSANNTLFKIENLEDYNSSFNKKFSFLDNFKHAGWIEHILPIPDGKNHVKPPKLSLERNNQIYDTKLAANKLAQITYPTNEE